MFCVLLFLPLFLCCLIIVFLRSKYIFSLELFLTDSAVALTDDLLNRYVKDVLELVRKVGEMPYSPIIVEELLPALKNLQLTIKDSVDDVVCLSVLACVCFFSIMFVFRLHGCALSLLYLSIVVIVFFILSLSFSIQKVWIISFKT
jgi:hypothetical protein